MKFFCDKLMPIMLKVKCYRTVVRSAPELWVRMLGSQEESGTEDADSGNAHDRVYESAGGGRGRTYLEG